VRFNLHLSLPDDVKQMDRAILMDEQLQNMAPAPVPWSTDTAPLGVTLQFWSPQQARDEFLITFNELAP
jgi:hypothetical protein